MKAIVRRMQMSNSTKAIILLAQHEGGPRPPYGYDKACVTETIANRSMSLNGGQCDRAKEAATGAPKILRTWLGRRLSHLLEAQLCDREVGLVSTRLE